MVMTELIAANLIETLQCFARLTADARVLREDGAVILDAGVSLPLFCCAVLTTPVMDADDLGRRIAGVKDYFGNRRGWAIWHSDALCGEWLRRTARRIYRDYGLQDGPTCPAMAVEDLRPPRRTLPALQIRPLADLATRQSFIHILTTAFDGPPAQMRAAYGEDSFWTGPFEGYVGHYQGLDVTAGATLVSHGTIGLYAVGTLPGHTRRGYAEAAMRQAISQARQKHGSLPVILQSSASALSLYRQMGFRTLTTYSLYTAKGSQ
jgi:GNAT superfamily N-acetyltransferase